MGKKYFKLTGIIIICFFILLFLFACTSDESEKNEEIVKSVVTKIIEEENMPVFIESTGYVNSKDFIQHAYINGGVIKEIPVKKGQEVEKGQVLSVLDTFKIEKAVYAANAEKDAADKAFELALDSYEILGKAYDTAKNLYQAGNLDEESYQNALLAFKEAEGVYIKSEMEKRQAEVNLELKQDMLEDARLVSSIDGYVTQILYNEKEIAGAGYPVVIVRSKEQVITTGLAQEDAVNINIGMIVDIYIEKEKYKGSVSYISQVPDDAARTYTIEVEPSETIPEKFFYIGAAAKLQFNMGNREGIWIDIVNIMNDGIDYVYTVENGRTVRKNIEINGLYEDKVKVTGLEEEDRLVISGSGNIREGYKVIETVENERE